MKASLTFAAVGTGASVQDLGRFGHRRIGVPWSGALAPELLIIANHLVGNAAGAAAIECFSGGQILCVAGAPLRLAVAGEARLELESGASSRPLAAWQSHRLLPGECLHIGPIHDGRVVVVAVAGLEAKHVLGSASAHTRSGLGGHWLRAGDSLRCAAVTTAPERQLPDPPIYSSSEPYRVIAGPQAEHFDPTAWQNFLGTEYRISPAADRMGMRLEGPRLPHRNAESAEIVSDAIVPGAIQVPGHGQPIVLLADAQTAGGYPKIATIISADLPRLATRKPGDTLRFVAVDAQSGEQAAREAATQLRMRLDSLRSLTPEGIDLAALYPEEPAAD